MQQVGTIMPAALKRRATMSERRLASPALPYEYRGRILFSGFLVKIRTRPRFARFWRRIDSMLKGNTVVNLIYQFPQSTQTNPDGILVLDWSGRDPYTQSAPLESNPGIA